MTDDVSPPTPPPTPLARLGRIDWVVYGLVACLLGLASLVQPAWRASSGSLRLTLAFYRPLDDAPQDEDPWGHSWRSDSHGLYSSGPDGRDDAGRGDDVRVLPPGAWQLAAYDLSSGLCCALAVLLVLGWEGARLLRSQLLGPRGPLPREVARAALFALPATAVAGAVLAATPSVFGDPETLGSWRASLQERLVVPLPLALFGSIYVGSLLGLLALRLSRPPVEPAPERDVQGRPPPGR